jgi:hypothetical protein
MTTGKSIIKERWLFTKNLRTVLKLEKEKVLKHSLDLFQLSIKKKFNELAKVSYDISLVQVKNEFNGKTTSQTKGANIVEIMDRHNTFFEKKVTAGERSKASFQKYGRCKELLVNFMKQQYGVEDLSSNEISSAFAYNLESYLKYVSNFKGRIGIKNNSIVKYMRMYKTACNYCIRMGLMEKNPFNLYDGKLSIKDAVFLTLEGLD